MRHMNRHKDDVEWLLWMTLFGILIGTGLWLWLVAP